MSEGQYLPESPPESPVVIGKMDPARHRFPCSIVWTPLPLLSWFIPFIGHMGIATSSGVIRDFAGPYFVSEDNMAFGWPTKYWVLDPYRAQGGPSAYDRSVLLASEEYQGRMHNLFCDNCHSHVAMALNLMHYDGVTSWNMVKLCFLMILHGKYVRVLYCLLRRIARQGFLIKLVICCALNILLAQFGYVTAHLLVDALFWAFVKTWLPFLFVAGGVTSLIFIV